MMERVIHSIAKAAGFAFATTKLFELAVRMSRDEEPAKATRDRNGSADPVTEASMESFPASDPPAWTPTAAT